MKRARTITLRSNGRRPATAEGGSAGAAPSRRRAAFTLIELLVVIAIIMILMGMFAVAVSRARRQARLVQAQAGARELVDAWRAYWIVYGRWPDVVDGKSNVPADATHLDPLLGGNPRGLVFFELDPREGMVEKDGPLELGFVDPWMYLYRMWFEREEAAVAKHKESIQVAVTFSNRDRYK